MNSRPLRTALALTALLAVFSMFLGCGTGPANTNQTNASNTGGPPLTAADPCTSANKVAAINAQIKTDIDNDPILKFERDQGKFGVTVAADANSYIEMTVKGKVIGSDGNGQAKFKDLYKIIEKYMKKGCVQKVVFEGMTSTTAISSGFEWILCEPPLSACPNGECASVCNGMLTAESDSATVSAESKTASNANSQKGVSPGSNVNTAKPANAGNSANANN